MSNKELTALEWLIEQWPILEAQIPPYILEQAKKMEKEQIMDAWDDGQGSFCTRNPEQYYKETFGGKDE